MIIQESLILSTVVEEPSPKKTDSGINQVGIIGRTISSSLVESKFISINAWWMSKTNQCNEREE